MVVKITMGGIPLKTEMGLLFELPEGMEWGQVKRTALQQMLMNRIMEGALPDDSKVDALFPIEIRMPCCNKLLKIKSYDDFPNKTKPCCDYGNFVLIRVVNSPPRPPVKPPPQEKPTEKSGERESFGAAMGKSIADAGSKCPKCGGRMVGMASGGSIVAVCEQCGQKLKV